MDTTNGGRHRAPGRYNPLAELGVVVSTNAQPVAKSSAVLAASGSLIAAFTLPTQPAAEAASASASEALNSGVTAAPAFTAPAFVAPELKGGQPTVARVGSEDIAAIAKGPSAAQKRAAALQRRAAQARAQRVAAATTSSAARASSPRGQAAPSSPSQAAPSSRQSVASRSQSRPTFTPQPATSGGAIGIARQYIGLPYRYGGTSPITGFDCSGFTQFVFARIGVDLPRTAESQRQATSPVSNPQPGDLVFYGVPAYHVGIYVGGGMMIDSPHTGSSVRVRPVYGGASYRRA